MADKTTASSSTANKPTTNPTTPGVPMPTPKVASPNPTQPTTNKDNMFIQNLNIEKRPMATIERIFTASNLELTQANLEALCEGSISLKGIGPKTIEAIKTALAELIVEKPYKPRPISRSVITTIANGFTYGKKTDDGTQARTIFDLIGNATSCLVMADDWSPQDKEIVASYGFIPISKTNKGQTAFVSSGETISDFVFKMLPDSNREERRNYIRKLKKCNPGLVQRQVKWGRTIELPAFGNNTWKLSAFGLQEFLGSFMPNATRQREYARFFMTTHSAGVTTVPEYLVAPVVFLSSEEKLSELNERLKLSDGSKVQEFKRVGVHSSGAIIAERWNDGQHWISREAAKEVGAHTLSMGRTVNLKGFEELIASQGKVNKTAFSLHHAMKEFRRNAWKKASNSEDAYSYKFLARHQDLHVAAIRTLKMIDAENVGKMIFAFEMKVANTFYNVCEREKTSIPACPNTTFSKGTYLVAHKDEFSFPEKRAVGIFYADIKSQNKTTMKSMMINQLETLPDGIVGAHLNSLKEYYHVLPTGEETCFSLLKNVEVGSSSWGHQLMMWYQNFVALSPQSRKELLDRTGISSQEEYVSVVKELASKALKLKFGTDVIQDLVLQKTKGSLANEASINVFDKAGLDWIASPDGKKTFTDTFESVFQDLFKGRFFEPDRSTFIAPNLFRALQMVKEDVTAIVPLPSHIKQDPKSTVEARIGRYPSNTADNPLHCKVSTSRKLRFSILGLDAIIALVADVDGDELVLLLKLALDDLEGKALLKQEIWNLLVDLSIEKCTDVKCEIEDVKPIQVIKTLNKWTSRLDPEIKKIVLHALIYPNQAAVGPVANHIQSISIHDLMSVFLMLILGALLQNAIDTQKSLNDFFWGIEEADMVERDGRVYFPDPKDWRLPGRETLQKVLRTDPYGWRARNCKGMYDEEKVIKRKDSPDIKTYLGFSPEIILPVVMKEFLLKHPEVLVPVDSPEQYVKVSLPWSSSEDSVESFEFTIHVNYFSYFKTNSPYMPGIQAISHWIKFQLQKANPNVDLSGYSQAKTPWHTDSTGEFTHEWARPYGVSDEASPMKIGGVSIADIGNKSDRFLTAGQKRVVSTWYDTVKGLAEGSCSKVELEKSSMWSLTGKKLSADTFTFLRGFNVEDKNAYTSSNVPKHVAEEIVNNFSEAAKHMVVLEKADDGTIIQVVSLLEKLFKLKKTNSNATLVNGAISRIDIDFWSLPILPFGLDWNQSQAEKLEIDLDAYILDIANQDVSSIARRNHSSEEEKQEAINNLALREEGTWISIKRKLQSIFEFFAAQTLESACPIWTEVKGHLTPDKKANWEEVYEALSSAHQKPLHKCPSCYREFLSWKGGSSVNIDVQRFGAAGQLLKTISQLPAKASRFGMSPDQLPPFLKQFVEVEAVELPLIPGSALTEEAGFELDQAARNNIPYDIKIVDFDKIHDEDASGFDPFAW